MYTLLFLTSMYLWRKRAGQGYSDSRRSAGNLERPDLRGTVECNQGD